MMKKRWFQKQRHKKSGESLVEVLIAVLILTIFLTSILSMLNQALFLNENIRMRVMAINLAREGIEGVRNIRDSNWLAYSGNMREKWLEGLPETSGIVKFVSGKYVFESSSDTQLYLDSNNAFVHGSGSSTPFRRAVELETVNAGSPSCAQDESDTNCPQKLKVTSRVTWTEDSGDKEVVLETHLFDYFKRDDY